MMNHQMARDKTRTHIHTMSDDEIAIEAKRNSLARGNSGLAMQAYMPAATSNSKKGRSWLMRQLWEAPPQNDDQNDVTRSFSVRGPEDVRRVVREVQNRNRGIIDPRTSGFIQNWDLAMMLLLLFTALVTPYEVVFLEASTTVTPLFVVNRLVDISFCCDMWIQFHLGFQAGPRKGSKWIMDRSAIRCRYLSFWFWIDVLSIMPLWIISFAAPPNDDAEADGASGDADGSSSGKSPAAMLQIMRLIRLLRLIKVTRILKASKIFRRLEMTMEFSYGALGLAKLLMTLFSWGHIQACLWGLLPQLAGEDYNWIVALRREHADCDTHPTTCETPLGPWDVYSAAFYWSVMTLTSVGYGQMLPVNTGERIFCSFLMLFSSMMWCYVMGQACGIAAQMDPGTVEFHMIMDQLNRYMRERGLPHDLKIALRSFFHNSRQKLNDQRSADVVALMSPLMKSTTAVVVNQPWLEKVWWLRAEYHPPPAAASHAAFVASISMKLEVRAFIAQERLPSGTLCIMRRGLVCRNWHILCKGKVWGEDLILDNPDLIDFSEGVALTYVEIRAAHSAQIPVHSVHRAPLKPLHCVCCRWWSASPSPRWTSRSCCCCTRSRR